MKIEAMKITLHEMRFYAYHGVFAQEQRVGNHFIVELSFWADIAESLYQDELEETISYADVYEVIKAEMAIPSRLLEHVVGRISERLFATFPRMQRIALTLSKCNPPFPGEVHSAAVTLEACRS
jgi:dihydroneopterin aldolase